MSHEMLPLDRRCTHTLEVVVARPSRPAQFPPAAHALIDGHPDYPRVPARPRPRTRAKRSPSMLAFSIFVLSFTLSSVMAALGVRLLQANRNPATPLHDKPGDVLGGFHAGMLTASIALFGILVTGVFVFMSLRIDRGARQEATTVAMRVAREEVATT